MKKNKNEKNMWNKNILLVVFVGVLVANHAVKATPDFCGEIAPHLPSSCSCT